MNTKHTHIQVRVPDDLHRRAKVIAAQTGRNFQDILTELIKEFVSENEQRLTYQGSKPEKK